MQKKLLNNLNEIKEIIIGEASWACYGIKIKCNSEIPFPLKFPDLKNPEKFSGLDYQSAVNYIETILNESSSDYNGKNLVTGEYKYSKRNLQKHNLKIKQEIETIGPSKKTRTKILEILVSFKKI